MNQSLMMLVCLLASVCFAGTDTGGAVTIYVSEKGAFSLSPGGESGGTSASSLEIVSYDQEGIVLHFIGKNESGPVYIKGGTDTIQLVNADGDTKTIFFKGGDSGGTISFDGSEFGGSFFIEGNDSGGTVLFRGNESGGTIYIEGTETGGN